MRAILAIALAAVLAIIGTAQHAQAASPVGLAFRTLDDGVSRTRVTVPEDHGSINVQLRLTHPLNHAFTASISKSHIGGSMGADDYSGVPASIRFERMEMTKEFVIEIVDDDLHESSAQRLKLSIGKPYGVDYTGGFMVRIKDDDERALANCSGKKHGHGHFGNSWGVFNCMTQSEIGMYGLTDIGIHWSTNLSTSHNHPPGHGHSH